MIDLLKSFSPSLFLTALFAATLWFTRKTIATYFTRGIEHEFEKKLEKLRSELRVRENELRAEIQAGENEIAALRSGALTGIASRQAALDQRRLRAAEEIWAAVVALGPARVVSEMLSSIRFERAAKEVQTDLKMRSVFQKIGSTIDLTKMASSSAESARPFVPPSVWAAFLAYRTIVGRAVAKLEILKTGVGSDILNKELVPKLIKAVLPHQSSLVDEFGEDGYFVFVEELEANLLKEIQNMLAGHDLDETTVRKSAEIVRLSREIRAGES